MNEKLLEAARKYSAQGISVIPTIGKVPAIQSWKEFQNRVADEYDFQRWYDVFNATGIAAVTGSISGICVIDVDDLTQLPKYTWPDTVKAHSGRGIHLYFKYNASMPLRSKTGFMPGMDIKAEGGLCTLPPSRHVATDKEYVWEVPFERERLAELPVWVISAMKVDETAMRAARVSHIWPNYAQSYNQITHGMVQEAKDVLIEFILPEDLKMTTSGHARKVGLCPFHDEKTPSFTHFLNSNSYYCFGCEKGGDVIDLAMNLRGCTIKEAVLRLYKGEWMDEEKAV